MSVRYILVAAIDTVVTVEAPNICVVKGCQKSITSQTNKDTRTRLNGADILNRTESSSINIRLYGWEKKTYHSDPTKQKPII